MAATTFDPSQSESQNLNFGFAQNLPLGGSVSATWDNGRGQSNSKQATLASSYSSGLNFHYTQPLLRGFGHYSTERAILIAQNNSRISRLDFRLQVTTIIQQVVNAYWRLVNAREQLGVAQESLQLANDLH